MELVFILIKKIGNLNYLKWEGIGPGIPTLRVKKLKQRELSLFISVTQDGLYVTQDKSFDYELLIHFYTIMSYLIM